MKKFIFIIILSILAINLFSFDELWLKSREYLNNGLRSISEITYFSYKIIDSDTKELVEDPLFFDLNEDTIIRRYFTDDEELMIVDESTGESQKYIPNNDEEVIDSDNSIVIKAMEYLFEPNSKAHPEGFFFEDDPKRITVSRTFRTKFIDDELCQGYEVEYYPNLKNKLFKQTGLVWISLTTGAPRHVDLNTSLNFLFMNGVKQTFKYGFDAEKQRSFLTESETIYTVSFLSYNYEFVNVEKNENYFDVPVSFKF